MKLQTITATQRPTTPGKEEDGPVAPEILETQASKVKLKNGTAPKIWIDLDNSPHVPFFVPIIEELEKRGCCVVVTARDSANVCDLLELFNLRSRVVGRHPGKHKLAKIVVTCLRSLQLVRIAFREK